MSYDSLICVDQVFLSVVFLCVHRVFLSVHRLILMCNMTQLQHTQVESKTAPFHVPIYIDMTHGLCNYELRHVTWHSLVTRLIHMCVVAHSYMWHESFICVTWHTLSTATWLTALPRDTTISYVSRASFTYVTWLMHMCDVAYSYVWHDTHYQLRHDSWHSVMTRLIHMCNVAHSYVWHDSFICVVCLIHMCDMTHPHVW